MLAELADPPLVARLQRKPPPEHEEEVYFIELRYREHLAAHALQELFESGALNDLSA
jgi:hypothetical protein